MNQRIKEGENVVKLQIKGKKKENNTYKINGALLCPNCSAPMVLEKLNIKFNDTMFPCDKWGCGDCAHIIVLDVRFNK